ncbi:alpha/beta hydrolase [Nocardia sp. NPDC101769]|uniref:alpha/beta hydrolase n=1 Tax=Nocardia sp. NPDC101769 TaxID=3364333 RepID=UPI00381C3CC8
MEFRRIRLIGAVSAAVLVAAGCTARTPGASGPEELHWSACPPGTPNAEGVAAQRDPAQQCATLTVPRDYSAAGRGTITVTVSRIATAKPGARKGFLLVSPGGPGMPGLDQPGVMRGQLPAAITDTYDLVGLDDRGIGNSTPVHCGLNDADRAAAVAGVPFPAPDGTVDANIAYAKRVADTCARNAGDYLRDITTANVARDIDRFRAALRAPTLSYLGTSYGTYLGAVYATLFPSRTDRVVLDSVVNPLGMQTSARDMFSRGAQDAFPALARWLAAADATLHLGTDESQVEDSYYRTTERLDHTPIRFGNGRVLDGNRLRILVYECEQNEKLYPLVANAFRIANGETAPASTGAASNSAALPTEIPDNFLSAQYAVMCDDVHWQPDTGQFPGAVAADKAKYPIGNGFGGSPWVCNYWHYPPKQEPVRIGDNGPADILLLQNRFDPSTPYSGARQTLTALGTRAAMVTVENTGHGVDFSDTCVQAALISFFAGGHLPTDDPTCG